jgi:hypothetical protein
MVFFLIFGFFDLVIFLFLWKYDYIRIKAKTSLLVTTGVAVALTVIMALLFKMEYQSGTPLWNMYGWPSHFVAFSKDVISFGSQSQFEFFSIRYLSIIVNILFFALLLYPICQMIFGFKELGIKFKFLLILYFLLSMIFVVYLHHYTYIRDTRVCQENCIQETIEILPSKVGLIYERRR